MLKLILGRQKAGKTTACLDIAKQASASDKSVIMLVPEQYSFECQRHLLNDLGSKLSNKIEIHSFTSLSEAICSVYGGLSGHNVDDGTRYILVGQALKSVRDSLMLYGKYADSQSFIKSIMSVITEFKQSSVTPEMLKGLAQNTDSEVFKNKLLDTALIMQSYDALLGSRFVDPLDLTERTVALMKDNSYFHGKTVIIDEFKGFTEAQFSLLDRIVSGSDEVYVSLCCDGIIPDSDTDIFKNIKNCASRLVEIAKNHNIEADEPLKLSENGRFAEDITALEAYSAEKCKDIFDKITPNIAICNAPTVYDEIDFCFNTIRKTVRETDMRYRDFVIISRDSGTYSDIIADVADIYGIPCYVDRRVGVSKLPLSVFVQSGISAAMSLDSDDILRFVKTGLAGLDVTEISKLENYVYMWSINGDKWLEPWTMSLKGLDEISDEIEAEKVANELEVINTLRERVVMPLKNLRYNLKGTVEDMCSALLKLIDDCDAISHLRDYTSELTQNGALQEAEYQRAGYDIFIKVLDKLTAAADSGTVKQKDFYDMLTTALSYETVGEIPQTLDQVIYGTADRIRPKDPKVVFVVGANQDVFPASVNDTGIFSQYEREKMIDSKMKIADRALSDCLDEKYLFYFAVSCGLQKVYICYPRSSASGAGMEPSMEVDSIKKAFPNARNYNLNGHIDIESCEVKEAAFRRLAEHYRENNETVLGLKAYFSNIEGYKDRLAALERFAHESVPSISEATANELYHGEVKLSASKVDNFAKCSFMYFCKHGLGANRIDKIDLDGRTRGNIVHDVLELFVKSHFNDIGTLDAKDIRIETDELCDKFLQKNCPDTSALDEKFNYMMSVVKDTAATLVEALNNEFAVSSFKPKFCELHVGKGQAIKGIDLKTNRGHDITLDGYIDRVDTSEDGKVRVIDYKTGNQGDSLKLADLLNGKSVQMLLYLNTLIKNGKGLTNADIPAGALYFPAKRHTGESKTEYVRMNGVVLDDMDTLKQMEPELLGEIIPAHARPNGASFYSKEAMLSRDDFNTVFNYVELLLQNIGNKIMNGAIAPNPLSVKDKIPCDYCDYKTVCRFDPFNSCNNGIDSNNANALELMKKELEDASNGD